MAGRKQHHIPQSFLKAFAVPSAEKTKKVWVFTREKSFNSAIKDVAAERSFYSEFSINSTGTLDDRITEYENRFSYLLTALREATPKTRCDPTISAEVVAHLTIRNAHFRRSVTGGLRSIIDRAVDHFSDENILRAMMGVDARELPAIAKAALDEQFERDPRFKQIGLPQQILYKVAHMAVKENFSRLVLRELPFMQLLMQRASEEAPEIVRRGHNRALSIELAPDGRIEPLTQLDWSVHRATTDKVILPDCVALGIEEGQLSQPLVLTDLKNLEYVLMPLSPDRILIGRRSGYPLPTLESFNQDAAACSHSFFISHQYGSDLSSLGEGIGNRSQESIGLAINAAFEEFTRENQVGYLVGTVTDPRSCDEGQSTEEKMRGQSVRRPPSYPVTFKGKADKQTAEIIAALINDIVVELHNLMPLDRLDGFTFAEDYEGALRDLDRGFNATVPLVSSKLPYGIGIARTPIVVRDGLIKAHIVARMWIGTGLLVKDEVIRRQSLHAIVQQLAHVACNQTFDESLPGVLLNQLDDKYEAFFYPYIDTAWSGYFSARASAAFDPPSGAAYRELLIAAIEAARNEIPTARLSYRFDEDLDRLLAKAVPSVGAILGFGAQMLGHYDGLHQSALDDPQLEKILDEAKLRVWAELFQSDLALIWDRRGKWTSIKEFTALNCHVERLLWQFGLFPWETPEGEVRVEIPLASDAAQLVGVRSTLKAIWWQFRGLINRLIKKGQF